MPPVSFKRHRFPPDVIRLAVWLYFRFTLSLRDVEEGLTTKLVAVESGARCAVTLTQPPDSRRSLPAFGTVAASDG